MCPQGLKANSIAADIGTAEAVPLHLPPGLPYVTRDRFAFCPLGCLVGGSNVFGVLPVWDHLPRTSVYWNQQLAGMNPMGPNRNKGLRG